LPSPTLNNFLFLFFLCCVVGGGGGGGAPPPFNQFAVIYGKDSASLWFTVYTKFVTSLILPRRGRL
ncbi:MAG: hypothetical protein LBC27_07215, partial [Spirochaetaceae bacterium]|nr:hypothetical protein [Spirochaetaceae bacterium]